MAIGYACVHIGSEATKLSALRLATASPDRIRLTIQNNLNALDAMLRYNAENGIRLFRISSDIIPLASHPAMTVDWQAEYKDTLHALGRFIKRSGIRVSMHPGQYTVLNSPHPQVLHNAIADLRYHNAFLDALGCDSTSKIIVHIGGVYGDKAKAMERFIRQYHTLDSAIQARLAIENDDVSYTADDVMDIASRTGLPVVFDVFHHQLNHADNRVSLYDWIGRCGATWHAEDGKQKIHYSQGHHVLRGGAHSETIAVQAFREFYDGLPGRAIDIMLEVKDKNLSAVKCILATMEQPPIRQLEEEWARYKYLVLSQSAAIYTRIRGLLKEKSDPQVIPFYAAMEEAAMLPEHKGAQVNAAQHVWGYVNEAATPAQKARFQTLLSAYQSGQKSLKALKGFLFRLAKQQDSRYLLASYYFYR